MSKGYVPFAVVKPLEVEENMLNGDLTKENRNPLTSIEAGVDWVVANLTMLASYPRGFSIFLWILLPSPLILSIMAPQYLWDGQKSDLSFYKR